MDQVRGPVVGAVGFVPAGDEVVSHLARPWEPRQDSVPACKQRRGLGRSPLAGRDAQPRGPQPHDELAPRHVLGPRGDAVRVALGRDVVVVEVERAPTQPQPPGEVVQLVERGV